MLVLCLDSVLPRHNECVVLTNYSNSNNDHNRIQSFISRFLTISSLRRELSPTRTLMNAYHVRHVVLRATWYEGTAQLLKHSLNHIYFSFVYLAEPLTDEGGEETGVPGENPLQRASENATYCSLKI